MGGGGWLGAACAATEPWAELPGPHCCSVLLLNQTPQLWPQSAMAQLLSGGVKSPGPICGRKVGRKRERMGAQHEA